MRLFLLLILSALFVGCGQRGPLYLPEDPDETPAAEAAETPPGPDAGSLPEPAEEDQEEDDAPEP